MAADIRLLRQYGRVVHRVDVVEPRDRTGDYMVNLKRVPADEIGVLAGEIRRRYGAR